MNMKKKIFLALAFCLFLGTSKVSAATVKSYFPDEKLFTCLATTASIDENTDENDFDFSSVVSLQCNTGVSDASGIEKLTGLARLNLDRGELTSIDLSKNTSLQYLSLAENKLSSIDLSNNTALTDVTLSGNQFTTLDFTKNTALTSLNLINNKISSVDLTKNTALTVLNISKNELTGIDLSNNTALISLIINNNPLLKNVELTVGDEFVYTDYVKVPSTYTTSYSPIEDVVSISAGKIIAKKVGSEVATLVIKNKETNSKEEFASTITVVEPKSEDTAKEEKTTSETTENPKTGVYGGSIVLILAAGGAYLFMKNRNKYSSLR